MRAWRESPPRRCCIAGRASPTASPTCTTPAARTRRSSTSSATTPPITGPFDAPLTADTEGLARTVSPWVRTCTQRAAVGADAAAAVQAALTPPGQIATLILPADRRGTKAVSRRAVAAAARVRRWRRRHPGSDRARAALRAAGDAAALRRGAGRGGPARGASRRACHGREAAHADAGPAHGARPRARAGGSHSLRGRQRSRCSQARGTWCSPARRRQSAFFAYPGKPATLWPRDANCTCSRGAEQDAVAALEQLADELAAPRDAPMRGDMRASRNSTAGLSSRKPSASTLAALLPENASSPRTR